MLESSANEINTISSNILNIVDEAHKNYVSGGVSGMKSFLESHCQDYGDDNNIEDKTSGQKHQKEDYQVRGDPREYQQLCFDICKARNTIVSLGTGQGKTLIALLSMRHFFKEGKKIWFLVPSIGKSIVINHIYVICVAHTSYLTNERNDIPFSPFYFSSRHLKPWHCNKQKPSSQIYL